MAVSRGLLWLLCSGAPGFEVDVANRKNHCVLVFQMNMVSRNFDCSASNVGRRMVNRNLSGFLGIEAQLPKCDLRTIGTSARIVVMESFRRDYLCQRSRI